MLRNWIMATVFTAIALGVTQASGAIGALLFAQADPAVPKENPLGLPFNLDVNSLSATAVLAWYAWYNASKVIPKLVADHREDVAKITEAHKESLTEERQHHASQVDKLDARLAAGQQMAHEDSRLVGQAISQLSQAVESLKA